MQSKLRTCILFLFTFLVWLFPLTSFGLDKQKVVLFTSINENEAPGPFWLPKRMLNRKFQSRLERTFRKFFEPSSFEVMVKHLANQYDLWKVLHSPEVVAVFWLSHSNYFSEKAGIFSQGVIVDHQGFDLKEAFSEIHPNIQFLGIVSCKSHPALDSILNSSEIKNQNLGLSWVAFPDFVSGEKGLKKALQRSEAYFNQPQGVQEYQSDFPIKNGFPLTIARKVPQSEEIYYPALRIENRGKILGVFPPAAKEEVRQELEVVLPEPLDLNDSKELEIIATTGSQKWKSKLKFSLGELEISSHWITGRWKVFTSRKGVVFGTTQNIYEYRGSGALHFNAKEFQVFNFDVKPSRLQ